MTVQEQIAAIEEKIRLLQFRNESMREFMGNIDKRINEEREQTSPAGMESRLRKVERWKGKVSKETLAMMAKGFGAVIREKFEVLEKRIGALDGRQGSATGASAWKRHTGHISVGTGEASDGFWQEGRTYRPGAVVVVEGSDQCWLATRETNERPPAPSGAEIRIATLEARIAELEGRKTLSYAGVWKQSAWYDEGVCTTHQGGLWVARIRSKGMRPGDGNAGWQLAVKRGRAE